MLGLTRLALSTRHPNTNYFLTAPVEVAPLSGSDSESDSPDTDSSLQTTDAEDEEDTTEDGPLVSDPVAETLQTAAGYYVSEDSANETEKARAYRCSCTFNNGVPCYTRFTPEEMVKTRDQMNEMTSDKLTAIIRFYKEHGFAPRLRRGARVMSRRVLSFEDIQRIAHFINNFADVFSTPLPGRIQGFKRTDIRVLPTTKTKSSVWRKYKAQMQENGGEAWVFFFNEKLMMSNLTMLSFSLITFPGHRAASNSTFRKLWKELIHSVTDDRPLLVLPKNNMAIYRSSNLPDCVKSAKLRKQEEHLRTVGIERQAYQEMVASSKQTVSVLGVKLGPNPPCSRETTIHYSFDYAQQLVGNESGETFVKTEHWHDFLAPSFRPLPGIRRYHHIRFTSAEPGVVYAKELVDNQEESYMLLRPGGVSDRVARPTELSPPGLDGKRHWYLYERIREFCTEEAKDISCPKPSTLHC
ncbi:hypothetical protein F7725_009613 [Dissostichus mawsoni]|uniref:Uncharacterized protein n=1 Tax=Dissostichus mawsoni TaxID=36200 RepID=A0A7J5XL80_DISMA|nr:hypothetical protein F7725_009613 [Dissostichus mawsoni]